MTDQQMTASVVTLIIIGLICVFLAAYAGARLAMRPRRAKVSAQAKADLAAMKKLDSGRSPKPAKLARHQKKIQKQHPRYGRYAIKTAPGPRDWAPSETD